MIYKTYITLMIIAIVNNSKQKCLPDHTPTFVRWSGLSPEKATPVFVYSASGEEASLSGVCLARCGELPDCAAVVVAYTKGNCYGVATNNETHFQTNTDVAFFKKTCLKVPSSCTSRWWTLENTPGYYFNSEISRKKVLYNTTLQECYEAMFSTNKSDYRSAQWIVPNSSSELVPIADNATGTCNMHGESRVTEPESYRVSNYNTLYIENQCGHDYLKKIDRCSYEEYNNQTLKHVDFTFNNYTKDECKSSCELENRFVCRGFSWTAVGDRGHCDLHSEDLISTGSWLTRRIPSATYYRRVICLNISVECTGSNLEVTYYPRGVFRGRMYVPGRGEQCSARTARAGPVRLTLPLHGDCDVNFAFAISKGPNGVLNRTLAYAMLMIQNNPIVQAAGDRWVRAGCSPGAGVSSTRVDATVAVQEGGRPVLSNEVSPAGVGPASAVFGSSPPPLTMYVVRAHADTGTAAVSLGEELELRIDIARPFYPALATEEAEIEAYHLVASSRLGDSSVLLLDSRGCPTGQVDFPAFTRTNLDGVQRLSARFKAFRFPTSHIVRFTLMVRFCDKQCASVNCQPKEQYRNYRDANVTQDWNDNEIAATVKQEELRTPISVGQWECWPHGRAPLQLELVVGARDILSADTLVRADHHSASPEAGEGAAPLVCVHELLLVALALAWLAVQVLLLLGCCVLIKRYRNLAEMNMQKDYYSFDNIGFDTVSTHRRVHWPDQNHDIILTN